MLHRSQYSNRFFIALMSLGFAGSLAIAPASNANPTSGSGASTTRTPAASTPATSTPAGSASQQSVPPSQQPGNTPVTNTQPGGAERDSTSRTPAASEATQTIQETTQTGQTGETAPGAAEACVGSMASGSMASGNATAMPRAESSADAQTPAANCQSMNPSSQSFEQALTENSEFSTLLTAIQAAELESTLASGGPFTLFAPTNEAFAAIPPETLRQLLLPENRQVLRQILTYHVVQGNLPSSAIKPGSVNTVEGSPVAIATNEGAVTVSGASVTQPDIMTSNGVIHAINEVLLPPSLQR